MRRPTLAGVSDKAKLVQKAKKVEQRAEKRAKAIKSIAKLGIKSLDKPATGKHKGRAVQTYIETINGTNYKVYFVEVPLPKDIEDGKVDLWNENSRFPEREEGERRPTQKQLFKVLADRSDVKSLYLGMKQNGGAILGEPPVAVPLGTDRWELIEGNERYVASIMNAQDEQQDGGGKFQTFTMKVYEGLTKKDALVLLSVIHGPGKSPWEAKEKARLYYNAIKVSGLSYAEYAKINRLNLTRLKIMIASYEANQNYINIYEGVKPRLFTYFTKLFGQKRFRVAMGMQPATEDGKRGKEAEFNIDAAKNSEFLATFMEWLALNKLKDCTEVDRLHFVLDDAEAKAFFLRGANKFEAAWDIFAKKNPQYANELYADMENITDLIDNDVSDDEVEAIKQTPKKVEQWARLRRSLERMEERVGCDFEALLEQLHLNVPTNGEAATAAAALAGAAPVGVN
jgi:hypothetical protein